ncbi:MAG TPA: hypothetical protein VK590_16025, partial [Saprospiraceae bacterium]|nr:hypothetical protein [Saprospiraceae bacterium]
YLSAMRQAIINMDQMRKTFGTSVVPDYVFKTIGSLTNPNDSIWNDKTQVKKAYKDVVNTMKKNRDLLTQKYRSGINATTSSSKSDKDIVTVAIPGGATIRLPRGGAKRLIKDHPDHKIIG